MADDQGGASPDDPIEHGDPKSELRIRIDYPRISGDGPGDQPCHGQKQGDTRHFTIAVSHTLTI